MGSLTTITLNSGDMAFNSEAVSLAENADPLTVAEAMLEARWALIHEYAASLGSGEGATNTGTSIVAD